MSSPFIFVLFLNFVLFHLFSLLVRDGSLDLIGGGGEGVCSQALRTYFFRANSLCKIFVLKELRLQEFFLTRL